MNVNKIDVSGTGYLINSLRKVEVAIACRL
jgi:hypothetical protein